MAGVGDLTHHAYVKTPKGWVRGAVRLEDPGPRDPRTQGEQLPGEGAPGPLLTPPWGTPALWSFPGCAQSPHTLDPASATPLRALWASGRLSEPEEGSPEPLIYSKRSKAQVATGAFKWHLKRGHQARSTEPRAPDLGGALLPRGPRCRNRGDRRTLAGAQRRVR